MAQLPSNIDSAPGASARWPSTPTGSGGLVASSRIASAHPDHVPTFGDEDTPSFAPVSDTVTDMGDPTLDNAAIEAPHSSLRRRSSEPPISSDDYGRPTDPIGIIDTNIGQVFGGKYLIERQIGEGGMGVVYLARHQVIHKRVAIKLLHANRAPEVVERFKVEARAASSIGDDHIVNVTDFAELPDGRTYFVMEYLDGISLAKLYHELGTVPSLRLARIAQQIALGLAAAHANGIVHRDLKPDNVLLCKRTGFDADFVKILDFGIAKVGQGPSKITKTGAIFGTPHYMSPEQAAGTPVDHRTDIYSLGVMLYQGAVGAVPFQADNFMGVLTQHMCQKPVPPRAHPLCPANLSPSLEVIIMRCLRKSPNERYASMEELAADLERLQRGEVPHAVRDMMSMSAGYQTIAKAALASIGAKPSAAAPPRPAPSSRSWMATVVNASTQLAMAMLLVLGLAIAWRGLGPSRAPSASSAPSASPASATGATSASASPSTAVMPRMSARPTATEAPPVGQRPRVILVSSTTAGARLFAGAQELGELPMVIDPREHEAQTYVVRARGFRDQPLVIDGQTPAKLTVNLSKLLLAPKPVAAPAPQPSSPTALSNYSDEPWNSR